jgi:hypothetical protein
VRPTELIGVVYSIRTIHPFKLLGRPEPVGGVDPPPALLIAAHDDSLD